MLGTPSEKAVDAGRDGVQDVERGDGARVGRVRRTARDEIAGGDLAAVVMPERFVAVVDADVAVEVWDGGVGRVDVQGEEAERVPERLNALAVDPSEEAAVGRDKPDGERGVDVGDEGASLDAFAVRELGGREATVGGDESRHVGTGADGAASLLDLLDESADDGLATAAQSPGALDVGVVDLSEGVERQGVGVKLHLHRRAGEDAAQARVGDGALEEFVGRLTEALPRMSAGGVGVVEEVAERVTRAFKHVHERVEAGALGGETLREGLDEAFAPLRKGVDIVTDMYLLKTRLVHLHPGEVEQAQVAEVGMEHFAGAESADAVEAGVERGATAAEGLEAAASLGVLLEDADAHATPCEDGA